MVERLVLVLMVQLTIEHVKLILALLLVLVLGQLTQPVVALQILRQASTRSKFSL